MERFLFCGQNGTFDITDIELQEDWISLPWGTKHEPFERVQITQYMQLIEKLAQNPIRSKHEEFILEHHSLLYSFNLREQEASSNVFATEIIMQDIRLLHYYTMNILNDPTIISRRSISELRTKLFDLFGSLNSEQLQSLTKTAKRQLDSQHWYNYYLIFKNYFKCLALTNIEQTLDVERKITIVLCLYIQFLNYKTLGTLLTSVYFIVKVTSLLIQTNRSLFLRQMTMLGSSVTLDIVKELMEEENISVADAIGLVSEFSMFLREPTDHVLQQLMVNTIWKNTFK